MAALMAVLAGCQDAAQPSPTTAPPRPTYTTAPSPTLTPTLLLAPAATVTPAATSTPLPLVRVGIDAANRPWCYTGDAGSLTGVSVDLLTALAAEMKVRLELVNTAPHLLASGLAAGRFDLAAGPGLAAGLDPAIVLSRPYITVPQTLVSGPAGAAPTSVAGIRGIAVGVQIGSLAASEVRAAGALPRLYDDLDIALSALERGEVSLAAGDRARAAYYLRSRSGTALRLSALNFAPRPVSLALSARSALLAPVNAALDALGRRGYLADLERRWLN
jgi:ABC-type amino acid transport substrate-binding protein